MQQGVFVQHPRRILLAEGEVGQAVSDDVTKLSS